MGGRGARYSPQPFGYGDAVGHVAAAPAKLTMTEPSVSFCRDVIDGVGVARIRFMEIALLIVDGNRPEAIDRNILHDDPVHGRPVIAGWGDIDVRRFFPGCRPNRSPRRSVAEQDRVARFAPEHVPRIRQRFPENRQGFPDLF